MLSTILQKKIKKSFVLGLLWIFVFLWVLLLTQGLPIGDFDDWDHILVSQDISWQPLLKNLAIPWSPSQMWHGQTERINEVTNRRIILTVVLKSIISIFGLHFFPLYIFSKAIFFSATVLGVFLLLGQITNLRWLQWVGMFFYLSVPAHYPHVLWITDPITMVHAFLVFALLAFIKLRQTWITRGEFGNKDFKKYFFIFYALGWLAMKTKEPAVTLPLAAVGVLILDFISYPECRKKIAFVFFACLHLIFLLVPITTLSWANQESGFDFDFQNLLRMLLRNYGCGYEDEKSTAFFSWNYVWPVSIARTFGFPLLWLTFAALIFVFFKNRPALKGLLKNPLTFLCVFWISIEIFFMGVFQPDPRYFSGTFIPLTLLMMQLFNRVYTDKKSWSRLGKILFLAVLTVTIITHLRSIVWLRLQIGKRSHRFLYTAQSLYQDQYQKNPNKQDVAFFYTSMYFSKTPHPRIEDVVYYSNLGYERWNKVNIPDPDSYEKAAQKGAVFYVNDTPEYWFSHYPQIQLFKTLSGINSESFFETVIYKIKNHPQKIFIYKWVQR